MLRKEDWIVLAIVMASIVSFIYFHVRSTTVEKAFTPAPMGKTYTTPAPSSEIEIKFRQKKN